MDEQIKISVIVPIYGVEKYIDKCVESLMEQTLDSIEYIFVDDNTKDNSIAIAKDVINRYPTRKKTVRWVHHSCNKGLPAARNSGLALAQGEYIYHCDSDDRLDPYMLEKLYTKAKNEDLDLVWCDFYIETEKGTLIEKAACFDPDKTIILRNYLTYGWNVVWNTICKREIYNVNNIRSLESISFCEDFELMSRLLMSCSSWGKVEEPLYYYNRINTNSMVRKSLSRQKMIITIENGIEAVFSVFDYAKIRIPELFPQIEKELNWRMLKAKTYLFFIPSERKRYLSIMPECHKDINSNPLCSKFQKLMQRLILSSLTAPIVWSFGVIFKLRLQ